VADVEPSTVATDRHDRQLIAALGLLALLPFLQTLTFGYVLDDTTIIRANQHIRGWSSLVSLWSEPYWAGGADQSGLYRPVILALFSTIWNAGLHAPFWFHLFALSLHVVVTILVWRLLRDGVGKWPAILAAAWFAVHPVHVEAVANITNSSEVLVALWTLLLAFLAKRAAATDDAGYAPTGVAWRSAVVLAAVFAAACLTKESGTVAPALVACWLWGWRAESTSRENLAQTISKAAERWWRVIVACVVVVAGVAVVRTIVLGGLVSGGTIAAPGLDRLSAVERVWSMLSLGPTFARLLIWPTTINPHYGPTFIDGSSGPTASALFTLFILAALCAIGVVLAKRGDRRVLVALAWMTIAFLPASNLVVATGQILAERTLYGSSVGVALLFALILDSVWRSVANIAGASAALIRVSAVATIVFALGLTGIRTAKFATVWRDHPTVFNQMVAADPAGYRGYWLLGMHQRGRGQPDSAITFLSRAYSMYPRDRQLLIDLSETLLERGDARRAASVAGGLMEWSSLRRQPEAVSLYLEAIGRAYGPDSVVAAGERLFAATPSATTALFLGAAQEAKGDRDAAIAAYRRGLQTAPTDSALRAKLALVR